MKWVPQEWLSCSDLLLKISAQFSKFHPALEACVSWKSQFAGMPWIREWSKFRFWQFALKSLISNNWPDQLCQLEMEIETAPPNDFYFGQLPETMAQKDGYAYYDIENDCNNRHV